MTEQDFQAKLGELIAQINQMPEGDRGDLEKIARETVARHDKMKKTIGDLHESLDYLRLSVKYLVFDLEATRRENEYLRKLVEKQAPGQQDQCDEDDSNGAD